MGANFQKCPANPRKSMKKRASSPFYWSRKRESNPPGSAWEADAIPLGDSCIFGCILFVSRFRGNGSTFAPLRGARWLTPAPAGISLGSCRQKQGSRKDFAKQNICGKRRSRHRSPAPTKEGRQGLPCSDAAIPAYLPWIYLL